MVAYTAVCDIQLAPANLQHNGHSIARPPKFGYSFSDWLAEQMEVP